MIVNKQASALRNFSIKIESTSGDQIGAPNVYGLSVYPKATASNPSYPFEVTGVSWVTSAGVPRAVTKIEQDLTTGIVKFTAGASAVGDVISFSGFFVSTIVEGLTFYPYVNGRLTGSGGDSDIVFDNTLNDPLFNV